MKTEILLFKIISNYVFMWGEGCVHTSSLELELHAVVSCLICMGARSQTQVLWKKSKCP